jgi:hypothetical protein
MKTFGLSVLGGIAGYVVGLFGGMALVGVKVIVVAAANDEDRA